MPFHSEDRVLGCLMSFLAGAILGVLYGLCFDSTLLASALFEVLSGPCFDSMLLVSSCLGLLFTFSQDLNYHFFLSFCRISEQPVCPGLEGRCCGKFMLVFLEGLSSLILHKVAIKRAVAFEKPPSVTTKPKQHWASLGSSYFPLMRKARLEKKQSPFSKMSSANSWECPCMHGKRGHIYIFCVGDASYSAIGGSWIRIALEEVVGCQSRALDHWLFCSDCHISFHHLPFCSSGSLKAKVLEDKMLSNTNWRSFLTEGMHSASYFLWRRHLRGWRPACLLFCGSVNASTSVSKGIRKNVS